MNRSNGELNRLTGQIEKTGEAVFSLPSRTRLTRPHRAIEESKKYFSRGGIEPL